MKTGTMNAGKAVVLAVGVMMALAISANAMNGKQVNADIVTVQWRGGSNNWGPATCDASAGWAGNIELVTVRGGVATQVDTIWNRKQGLGQYPTFSPDGRMIAFYRWPKTVNNNVCATTANGGKYTVSIMNRNGTKVKNLVVIRGMTFSEISLNWSGNWVYYINPRIGNADLDRASSEIRRVNVNTLADEAVYNWTNNGKYFRRFELTADGTVAAFQTYPIPGMTATPGYDLNGLVAFPPPNGSFPSQTQSYSGCNASVSASGTYASSYFAGNHTEISFHKIGARLNLWLPLYDKTSEAANWNELYPNRGNINAWLSPNEPVFNGSVINGSMGAEVMRWAANSDKWILQQVLHYGLNEGTGSNCVAANWVDKAAFLVSRNVKLPPDNVGGTGTGVIYKGNNAGDMWLDEGATSLGKWEDTAGVWHAINGFALSDTTVLNGTSTQYQMQEHALENAVSVNIVGRSVSLSLLSKISSEINITDIRGATVLQKSASGSTALSLKTLAAGTYFVVVNNALGSNASRIVVR